MVLILIKSLNKTTNIELKNTVSVAEIFFTIRDRY